MPSLGVNVDLDRIKFLSRQPPELHKDLAVKTKMLAVDINGIKYYSWIVYFVELTADKTFFEEIKQNIHRYFQKEVNFYFSGNGLEANKKLLTDLFGKMDHFPLYSQVAGIVQGLRVLIDGNPKSPYLYRLKPQSLLDIKSIKFTPEIELPSDVNFPLLIVNIKGGITYYKLEDINAKPKKVIASIFGEFSLTGLIKLLSTKFESESINSIIKRALKEGSNLKVDLTVGDIYGEGINQVAGLHKNIIASSIGKSHEATLESSDLDYIAGAIVMFAINVSNICSLVVG